MCHENVLVVESKQFPRRGISVPLAHCNTGNIYSIAKPSAVLVVVSSPHQVESLKINLSNLINNWKLILTSCYYKIYLLNSEVIRAPEQADAICWNGVIRNWGSSSRIILGCERENFNSFLQNKTGADQPMFFVFPELSVCQCRYIGTGT